MAFAQLALHQVKVKAPCLVQAHIQFEGPMAVEAVYVKSLIVVVVEEAAAVQVRSDLNLRAVDSAQNQIDHHMLVDVVGLVTEAMEFSTGGGTCDSCSAVDSVSIRTKRRLTLPPHISRPMARCYCSQLRS